MKGRREGKGREELGSWKLLGPSVLAFKGLTMPLSGLYELQTVRAIAEHLATQAAPYDVEV